MSLDSSEAFLEAAGGNSAADRQLRLSGRKEHAETNWVFLFTHRVKLDKVKDKLSYRFETFVHKTIVYQSRGNAKRGRVERPTISGLIFIHGDADDVQKYLIDKLPGVYLARNYNSGRIAEISNEEMSAFIKFATFGGEEIRFMLNTLDYYSKGHQRIRITSGALKGCEGYIIRIHRDRKLVTRIGNMTVAIGGITKESFENADELVETRKNEAEQSRSEFKLSPTEQKIDQYFFTPANDIEAMAIAKNLEPLIAEFQKEILSENAIEIVNGIIIALSEIADRFAPKYFRNQTVGIDKVCRDLVDILKKAIESPAIAENIKEKISIGLESMALRHPILPLSDLFNVADL